MVECELTYALGTAFQRQRYATEAAQALINLGLYEWGINRLVNAVHQSSTASVTGFNETIEISGRAEFESKLYNAWTIQGVIGRNRDFRQRYLGENSCLI